jgi:tRNA dimethylallyltransferase
MMETLAILGPTAVGKSSLARALAGRLDGEIVSIDSRKAYRGLDIGTAKPPAEARETVPHHLIDVLDLHEKNDAERFARMAERAVDQIAGRGRLPILVGGSGLYFRALMDGFFSIDLQRADREAFARSIERRATADLHGDLEEVDPESARRIHANDRYRIVRALEVHALTGIPLSEHFRRQRAGGPRRRVVPRTAGLALSREMLYERINERTRRMVAAGWVEEVERLLAGGADPSWPGLKTLGYPEMVSVVRGRSTREEAVERVSRLTRQYAKRQLTWFKAVDGVTWFDAAEPDILERVNAWFGAGR